MSAKSTIHSEQVTSMQQLIVKTRTSVAAQDRESKNWLQFDPLKKRFSQVLTVWAWQYRPCIATVYRIRAPGYQHPLILIHQNHRFGSVRSSYLQLVWNIKAYRFRHDQSAPSSTAGNNETRKKTHRVSLFPHETYSTDFAHSTAISHPDGFLIITALT